MSIVKPNFVCGAFNVSPEHPSDWDVPALVAKAENESLGGTNLRDISWRKYAYTLMWEAMSLTDFHNLETLINYHLDTGTPISFSYEKFRQSDATILVNVDPLTRKRKLGSGKTFYYQSVELKIKEIEAR